MRMNLKLTNGEDVSLLDCIMAELDRYKDHRIIKAGANEYVYPAEGSHAIFCVTKAYYENLVNVLKKITKENQNDK